MCVILKCTESRPEQELIDRCEASNGDGMGAAWFEEVDGERKVHYLKGIEDPEHVGDLAQELPLPYTLHFRTTTEGGTRPELTHPFPITAEAETDLEGYADRVLFHNGTISDWDEVMKFFIASHGPDSIPDVTSMSDSRAAAYLVHHLDEENGQGERYLPILSSTNRFLIMDAKDDEYPIRNWGTWYLGIQLSSEDEGDAPQEYTNGKIYETGIEFSNNYWK
jgi:predicted glutamine amidotransferase